MYEKKTICRGYIFKKIIPNATTPYFKKWVG